MYIGLRIWRQRKIRAALGMNLCIEFFENLKSLLNFLARAQIQPVQTITSVILRHTPFVPGSAPSPPPYQQLTEEECVPVLTSSLGPRSCSQTNVTPASVTPGYAVDSPGHVSPTAPTLRNGTFENGPQPPSYEEIMRLN